MKLIFVLLVEILILPTKCEMDVQWVAEQSVFRQGKDVRLKCWGTKCTPQIPKLWRGGVPYNVLCTETKSRNPEKYNLTTARNGTDFKVILMIKNISMADLNCNYTCNCGFSQYTKELSAKNFLYPPDTDQVYKSNVKENGDYYIAVNISKVYPKPSSCHRLLHTHNRKITNDLETEAHMTANLFYQVQVKSVLKCADHQSKIVAQIVCVVQGADFIVFNKTVNCEPYAAKPSMPISVVIVIVLYLFLLLIVPVAVVVYIKRCRSRAVSQLRIPLDDINEDIRMKVYPDLETNHEREDRDSFRIISDKIFNDGILKNPKNVTFLPNSSSSLSFQASVGK